MRKITAFNFLTINGYYKGLNDDISWHLHGEEGSAYSEEQLKMGRILLFGRKTYELMKNFWTSPAAYELYPRVADGMNRAEKLVVSHSLKQADWNNTRVIGEPALEQIRAMKQTDGKDITVLGSGSLVTQMTDAGLIDQYRLMIDPVAIGQGTPFFNNLEHKLELKLVDSRILGQSGMILLTYERLAPKEGA